MQDIVRAKITKKRIPLDIKEICESKDFQAVLLNANDMNVIWVKFKNPGGFYRNQTHIIELKLNTSAHNYPFVSPNVKFVTNILHTNISVFGNICLSILKGKDPENPEGWTEAYSLCSVVQAIFLLLECPNTSSSLNHDAAHLWNSCKSGKLEEQYIDAVDKYYLEKNNKSAIDIFDARYAEDNPKTG